MTDLAFLLIVFALVILALWVEARVRRVSSINDLPHTHAERLPRVAHATPSEATERAYQDREKHWEKRYGDSVKLAEQYRQAGIQHAREAAQLRTMLTLEQATRGMYEQLVIEAGEQIIKNKGVMPQTLLGVLRDAFVTAVATAQEWRAVGHAEQGEVTNVRATLATALLPEPDPKTQPDCVCGHRYVVHHLPGLEPGICNAHRCPCAQYRPVGGIVTERKRDGRVGDSRRDPDPTHPHIYEYDPFDSDEKGVNRQGQRCNLPGCGKALMDEIHTNGKPIFGGPVGGPIQQIGVVGGERMHVEDRPEDGPPQALPARHEYKAQFSDVAKGKQGLCEVPGCGRGPLDPIHR